MATNVRLPQWGMNMEDGLLVKWLVSEGDEVQKDQPLVEIETAKINSELESPVSGVVAHIMALEGSSVDVGTIVAIIGEIGETVERPESTESLRKSGSIKKDRSKDSVSSQSIAPITPLALKLAENNDVDLTNVEGTGPKGRITENDIRRILQDGIPEKQMSQQVVPRARLLAKKHNVNLDTVVGTGPGGRVTVADVELIVNAVLGVIPIEGMRKTIADRMIHSVKSAAPVTLSTEIDVTELVRMRQSIISEWRKDRIRPMDLDVIVKAVATSLAKHPKLNAFVYSDEIRLMKDINVGVATAISDGLIVPVIKRADDKDLKSIAKEIRNLADKARKSELAMEDMTDATFTVTSLAGFGIDTFTPIINPPQVAILGVGRIVEKPIVKEEEIQIRAMMSLSLTFDHRAIDGVPAAEFLQFLAKAIEDPRWML